MSVWEETSTLLLCPWAGPGLVLEVLGGESGPLISLWGPQHFASEFLRSLSECGCN